jgi:hypothetical protein
MNCPHCGTPVVCAACGTPVEELARTLGELEGLVTDQGAAAAPAAGENTFLIVARGHGDLLDQLKEVVGDLGWVRLVEDRRQDETILPREGRQGTVHVERKLES